MEGEGRMLEFCIINEIEGVSLLLPITPEGYEGEFGIDIETVGATAVGDIHITGHRKPQNIKISGIFTVKDYIFAKKPTVPIHTEMDYVLLVKKWIDSRTIVRVVVADESGAKINEKFYIEFITYRQSKEDNGDINYDISFKQYTPLKAPVSNKGASSVREVAKPPVPPKKYTVKKGDSLSKIAREVYGNAGDWRKMYEANKGVIGKNPNLIFPGQSYTLP